MPPSYWEKQWNGWLSDAFICRYGHQDVHKIRGIDRPLTCLEKTLFAHALLEHVKSELERSPNLGPVTLPED